MAVAANAAVCPLSYRLPSLRDYRDDFLLIARSWASTVGGSSVVLDLHDRQGL